MPHMVPLQRACRESMHRSSLLSLLAFLKNRLPVWPEKTLHLSERRRRRRSWGPRGTSRNF